jgi:ABC-type glycerol-3-phosphate transport system permease component
MIEAGRGAGAIVNIASMNATVAFPMRLAYNAAKAAIVSMTLATFFGAVPRALVEAAHIDGAGTLRTLLLIVLPLARPALVTVIVVQALWVWNEVLIAIIFLQQSNLRTLMVGLTVFSSRYHLTCRS